MNFFSLKHMAYTSETADLSKKIIELVPSGSQWTWGMKHLKAQKNTDSAATYPKEVSNG